jgi:hypothetical protein
MITVIRSISVFVFSLALTATFAQKQKTISNKPATVQKFMPPKLTCSLGLHSDSASVLVEEAVQLVKLPLRITDDKKNVYTISSYHVMYKRSAVTEDEETGKVSPVTSDVSELFRETPLTALWIKILSEQMRAGEELYFFDIVAKDAQGRLMFAPELRIKIKK